MKVSRVIRPLLKTQPRYFERPKRGKRFLQVAFYGSARPNAEHNSSAACTAAPVSMGTEDKSLPRPTGRPRGKGRQPASPGV